MRIALADCDPASPARTPTGVESEAPLHRALDARGVAFETPDWEDPDVDWGAFDAVVLRLTWTYHLRPAAFHAWLERVAAVTRLFNEPRTVRWNLDKGYLLELGAGGVPIAPTVRVPRGTRLDLAATLAERGWGNTFLKPQVGATASDTHRLRDAAELPAAQAFLDAQSARQDMLVQPYLGRVETEGEDSLVLVEGRATHAVRKTPVPGDYRVQDDFGASDVAIPVDPELERLAQRALELVPADEVPLYARADFLRLDDGAPVLNELELVEPMLFWNRAPESGAALADALLRRLGR